MNDDDDDGDGDNVVVSERSFHINDDGLSLKKYNTQRHHHNNKNVE